MKLKVLLVALAGLALHAGHVHAQSAPPMRSVVTSNRDKSRGSVAQTFGFAWGMTPVRQATGALTYGYPVVTLVVDGSNAARAGLAVGDTILTINGRDARQMPLFPNRQPGTAYVLRVRRGGEERELSYSFPAPPAATQ